MSYIAKNMSGGPLTVTYNNNPIGTIENGEIYTVTAENGSAYSVYFNNNGTLTSGGINTNAAYAVDAVWRYPSVGGADGGGLGYPSDPNSYTLFKLRYSVTLWNNSLQAITNLPAGTIVAVYDAAACDSKHNYIQVWYYSTNGGTTFTQCSLAWVEAYLGGLGSDPVSGSLPSTANLETGTTRTT